MNIRLSALFFAWIFSSPAMATPQTGSLPLSTLSSGDVKPNIMLTMDTSGSMAWTHMPDEYETINVPANTSIYKPGYRSNLCNGLFYNPNITYALPKTATGGLMTASIFTAAPTDGYVASGTVDLSTGFYPYVSGTTTDNSPIRTAPIPATEQAYYDQWVGSYAATPTVPTSTDCHLSASTGTSTHHLLPVQVRVATTANISLSGSPTVDGQTVAVDDMVLVKNQTTAAQNGIYTVASGAWVRHAAYNTSAELLANGRAAVYVLQGTVNKDTQWRLATTSIPTLGTTSLSFTQITGASNLYPWTKVFIPTGTAASSIAQQQNFANWFTYYRTRILTMKSSLGIAFNDVTSAYRIGFSDIYTLSQHSTTVPTAAPASASAAATSAASKNFLPISEFADATFSGIGYQKTKWYSMLYSRTAANGTPLKQALQVVGDMYAGHLPANVTVDPLQYSCQLNFTILTTDGYWNASGDTPTTTYSTIGNEDVPVGTIPRPMFDGANQTANLADVAMHFFKTDLRTSGPLSTNNAPGVDLMWGITSVDAATDAANGKGRQMMRTYTLGLGVNGTLKYSGDYETSTDASVTDFVGIKNGSKNWPTVVGDTLNTVDDLWHAAVNGGGLYFSAKDPTAVSTSIATALGDISAKIGSVGTVDASGESLTSADNFVFSTSYKTNEWTGEVIARTIDVVSGNFNTGNVWAAQALLDAKTPSTRVIYTCSTYPCASFTAFTAAAFGGDARITGHLGDVAAANSLSADAPRLAANTGANLVNYLRGDRTNEINLANLHATTSLYRTRTHVLGDIVHGGVTYVKEPISNYPGTAYANYVAANSSRTPMLYVPSNDGMLHAFYASNGQEAWTFIPNAVIPQLWHLADMTRSTNYDYLLDGVPLITDIEISTGVWRTILVGGLRGGGGEYYALDITDPLNPAPLWHFADSRLGKTYGFPVIGKVGGTWKVLVSSGYDNNQAGFVFVLDAATGALNKTITTACAATDGTCNISKIGVLRTGAGDSFSVAYAGDLAGNLWRFDVTGSNSTPSQAVLVAQTGVVGTRLPISSAPVVIAMPQYLNVDGNPMHYVTFGTGKYLEQSDLADATVQATYGLLINPKDSAAATDLSSDFSSLGTSSNIMTLVMDKTCDLTIKNAAAGSTLTSLSTVFGDNLSNTCPTSTVGDFTNADGNFDTITLERASGNSLALDTNCGTKIKGWRANLPISKERISNDPFLGARAVLFSSIIPSADACTPGGAGRQYLLPAKLDKGWLCSNPTQNQYIAVGRNLDKKVSDDPARIVSITTPTKDSQDFQSDGTLAIGEPTVVPTLRGGRTQWTQLP